MDSSNHSNKHSIFRVVGIMLGLLSLSSVLIYFGSRGDAASVAKTIKSGVVTADEVNIAFENVGGKLLKRYVEESDHVKKGDLLLAIDGQDLLITIENLNAQIDAQKAELDALKETISIENKQTDLDEKVKIFQIEQLYAALKAAVSAEDLASRDYSRSSQLISSKSISRQDYDNKQSELVRAREARVQAQRQLDSACTGATDEQLKKLKETSSAAGMTLSSIENQKLSTKNKLNDVAKLEANLRQLEAQLKQQQLNLKRLSLVAPEDGKILKVIYQNGEMISPNSPAVILETNRKYFYVYINETSVLKYKEKDQIKARLVAGDREISGEIRFITPAPSFADLRMTRERGQADLTMYKMRIYLNDPASVLSGMTVEVNNED